MKKIVVIAAIFCSFSLLAQDTIKVMTYNLLNYNNTTSYCDLTNNDVVLKDGYLATIFAHVMPDIFAACEVDGGGYTSCKRILDNVININGVTWYNRASYVNSNGSDIISTLFYDSRKFTLYNQNYISGGVRDIMIYKLYYNSPDISTLQDTVFLTCIVMHLKAGSYQDDLDDRAAETLSLMNYLNSLSSGIGNCLVMGDFNVQSSTETSFQNLVNFSNTNIRFYDPVSKLGTWNNNSLFADYHTQSTSVDVNNTCKASGGLDDRFDFILESFYIKNNIQKIMYVPNSYWAVGQDGNHYNQSVNNGTNSSVPSNVLTALANMSDHLPVMLKLKISQTPVFGISEHSTKPVLIQFENPIDEEAYFQVYSSKTDTYVLKIFNSLGEMLATYKYKMYPGYNQIIVPANKFNSGLYYFNFINSESNSTLKIMKK